MFGKENTTFGPGSGKWLLNVYLVLSLIFIVITLFDSVKVQYGNYMYNTGIQNGVQNGYAQAIAEALEKSGDCTQPFSIYAGEEKVDLINVACLQNPNETAEPVDPSVAQPEG